MDPTTFPHRVCSTQATDNENVVLALFLNRRLAYRFRDILWSDYPAWVVSPPIWVETLTLEGWLRDPD
jgi:hypothetical protein